VSTVRHFARVEVLPVTRRALAVALALIAVSLAAANRPYMLTRGKPVIRDRLFYGCKHAADHGCLTDPIPARDYDPSLGVRCDEHGLLMDQEMKRIPA
jgi:hypothetical protein